MCVVCIEDILVGLCLVSALRLLQKILICLLTMSSTTLKKIKAASKTKSKLSLSQVDAAPAPSPKAHKLKQAKIEEHAHKTKPIKLVKGEGIKQAEQPRVTTAKGTDHDTVADTRKHVGRTTRLVRKPRGPWKAPSSSPSPSSTSDLEPSHSEEEEPEAPQEEDNPNENDIHLYGFTTDEDSSDDDLDVDEGADLDVCSLPTVARDNAIVKRKLENAKRKAVRVLFCSLTPSCNYGSWLLRRYQKRV